MDGCWEGTTSSDTDAADPTPLELFRRDMKQIGVDTMLLVQRDAVASDDNTGDAMFWFGLALVIEQLQTHLLLSLAVEPTRQEILKGR